MVEQKFPYRIIIYLVGTDDRRVYGPLMDYTESQFKELTGRITKIHKDPNSTFETVDLDGNAVFVPSRNIQYIVLEKG
jgi:hypothetical protein